MSGLGAIITIILVVGWVVKGLASAMGNENQGQRKRPARSLEEWDELQAQRRAEMSGQQEALSEMRAQSNAPDPSQMTMAERIELARQRARQQAGIQADTDADRRVMEQAQQQARQQQQAAEQRRARQRQAEQQRAAQQRAQRERAQQQRRRQQQQAAAEQQKREQQRRRVKQRRAKQSPEPRAKTGSKRESVVAESIQRVHKGHEHAGPTLTKLASPTQPIGEATAIGKLDRDALRKAFIMKELLDKPVALRDPQADLPS